MRTALAVLVVLVLLGLGVSAAQADWLRLCPNYGVHPPCYVQNSYWVPCGYGIRGLTDQVYPCVQPVSGVGPPPYCPMPRGPWHCYNRSPRDFFMVNP